MNKYKISRDDCLKFVGMTLKVELIKYLNEMKEVFAKKHYRDGHYTFNSTFFISSKEVEESFLELLHKDPDNFKMKFRDSWHFGKCILSLEDHNPELYKAVSWAFDENMSKIKETIDVLCKVADKFNSGTLSKLNKDKDNEK